jgi:hypothetical protein
MSTLSFSRQESKRDSGGNGLSAWDAYTIKKLLKQADDDKDGKLTQSQVQSAFDNAMDYGIALVGNENHEMTEFLFEQRRKYDDPDSTVVSIKRLYGPLNL